MFTVTIDLGSYSLKILESRIDKKKPKHVNKIEIPLKFIPVKKEKNNDQFTKQEQKEKTLEEILPYFQSQIEALNLYLSKIPSNAKILFQSPMEITTTRFIEIPVKQKRKAEQMVPFQLEENIPFVISDIHLSSTLKKSANGFKSVSSYIPKKLFDKYWESLKKANSLPSYLTTEVSSWVQYIKNTSELASDETFCIFDIGHKKSIAYFVHKQEILAYNLCFIAGTNINEMIMTHYDVDYEKAVEFKHNNSFFLLKEQYHEVDARQKEFAIKMDESMHPLVREFKRWELSFRVNHGHSIKKIYLTGGTAQTKNIENYLTSALGTKVSFLDDFSRNFTAISKNRGEFLNFGNANALSYFYTEKQKFNNFLTGKFAPLRSEELPVYSISFVGLRVATVMVFLILALLVEGFFLNQRDKSLTMNIRNTLARPSLGIPSRDIKVNIAKKPQIILSKIERKIKTLTKEVTEIGKAQNAKGLRGLFFLTEKLQSVCHLNDYKDTPSGNIEAYFGDCNSDDIANLETSVKSAGFKELQLKTFPNKGKLNFSFKL